MTTKRLFTITDLGGGDGGKGGVVHKICCNSKAHTVLKVGGAQGSHGVRTSGGQGFNFSQFGCGTLEGVRTHITNLMVVEPYGFMHEAQLLRYEQGVRDILDMVTVDGDALCITPFHTFTSQLQELARKGKPKGTIGLGAGVAVLDSETHPDLAIHVKDLTKPYLRDKIAAIREQKIASLTNLMANISDLWPQDRETASEIVQQLKDEKLVDRVAEQFHKMGTSVEIVGQEHLQKLLHDDGTVVVESSHGILTDRYYGFHPNVSRLRTMPNAIWNMIEKLSYDGKIFKLGVCRAFAIRHGAGPMVTEDPTLVDQLLPGSHKENNRWQGNVRVGPIDFVALRYAINCCGGPEVFDGIAITWLDQIPIYGEWNVSNKYLNTQDSSLFTPEGEIKVRRGADEKQLQHQEKLGNALMKCKPIITTAYNCSRKEVDERLVQVCREEVLEKLGIPVCMISCGPTENDKMLF
jgi:adenylosuccinate synthase